jgi:cell envelope opacity-associated protein A
MSCDDKRAAWLAAQEELSTALAERTQAQNDKVQTEADVNAAIAADEAQAAVVADSQATVATKASAADSAYSAYLACVVNPPVKESR